MDEPNADCNRALKFLIHKTLNGFKTLKKKSILNICKKIKINHEGTLKNCVILLFQLCYYPICSHGRSNDRDSQ